MNTETAFQYLARCGLNEYAMRYARFMNACKVTGLKTRRSLWDILGGKYKHENAKVTLVVRKEGFPEQKFVFPVIKECCDRRGVVAPEGAIITGKRPITHRTPQARWSNDELKT